MNSQQSFVVGVIVGAGIMYLLDPDRGRRRRALIRDQVVHGVHEVEEFGSGFASRARHLRNRARGTLLEVRNRTRRESVDDTVLEQRVRAQLGRLVREPGSVWVTSEHGRITLRGSAREDEMSSLLDAVQEVPGVHDVINRLESRENAG